MRSGLFHSENNMRKRPTPRVSLKKEAPTISEHETRLRQAYQSVQQYLIGLVRFLRLPEEHQLRAKNGCGMRPMRTPKLHKDLMKLLKACKDWSIRPGASGHMTFVNSVTGITVCAIHHAGELNNAAKKKLMERIQEHMNILCNDVFMYKTNNWVNEPDYKQAVVNDQKRLASLRKESKSALPKVSPGLQTKRFRR